MRIDPTGINPQPVRSSGSTPARGADRPADAAGPAATDPTSFTLTGDLARLLSAVRNAPEVRAEVVEATATKLAAGELDTPAAAADTARSVLDAAARGE